jgi:hypothetical protein
VYAGGVVNAGITRFLNLVLAWYVFALSAMAACLGTIFLRLAPQLNDALFTFFLAVVVGELGVRLSLIYAAQHLRRHLVLSIAAFATALTLAIVAICQAVVAL